MKVLMLNGSSNPKGNTRCALGIVAEELAKEGIESEIFEIGAGVDYPQLHTAQFDFPDALIEPAVEMFKQLAAESLE